MRMHAPTDVLMAVEARHVFTIPVSKYTTLGTNGYQPCIATLPAPDNHLFILGVPLFRSVMVIHDLRDHSNIRLGLALPSRPYHDEFNVRARNDRLLRPGRHLTAHPRTSSAHVGVSDGDSLPPPRRQLAVRMADGTAQLSAFSSAVGSAVVAADGHVAAEQANTEHQRRMLAQVSALPVRLSQYITGLFVVDVHLGEPPQRMSVILDTGSSTFAVFSSRGGVSRIVYVAAFIPASMLALGLSTYFLVVRFCRTRRVARKHIPSSPLNE